MNLLGVFVSQIEFIKPELQEVFVYPALDCLTKFVDGFKALADALSQNHYVFPSHVCGGGFTIPVECPQHQLYLSIYHPASLCCTASNLPFHRTRRGGLVSRFESLLHLVYYRVEIASDVGGRASRAGLQHQFLQAADFFQLLLVSLCIHELVSRLIQAKALHLSFIAEALNLAMQAFQFFHRLCKPGLPFGPPSLLLFLRFLPLVGDAGEVAVPLGLGLASREFHARNKEAFLLPKPRDLGVDVDKNGRVSSSERLESLSLFRESLLRLAKQKAT